MLLVLFAVKFIFVFLAMFKMLCLCCHATANIGEQLKALMKVHDP